MKHFKQKVAALILGAPIAFLAACYGPAPAHTDRQLGEDCDFEHDCIPGLYCDSGICVEIDADKTLGDAASDNKAS